jgi:hypothetical protein
VVYPESLGDLRDALRYQVGCKEGDCDSGAMATENGLFRPACGRQAPPPENSRAHSVLAKRPRKLKRYAWQIGAPFRQSRM